MICVDARTITNYAHQVAAEKRKERLNLLNKQLNEFYGPLYILLESSKTALITLRHRLGGVQVFRDSGNPTTKELTEWRVWVETVFFPLNEKIEEAIINNAHLLRDEEVPKCLLTFVAHTSTYRAILHKWELGEFEEFLSPVEFPKELHEYAKKNYQELKNEQMKLLGNKENGK